MKTSRRAAPSSTAAPLHGRYSVGVPPSPLTRATPGKACAPRVLVVDDDGDTRALIASGLRGAGYSCVTARSGEEALAIVRRSGESLAVLVVDVKLGGRVNGFEVARNLRREHGAARVILISGSAKRDVDVIRGLEVGADDLIVKPFTPALLLAKVRAAFERVVAERTLVRALDVARAEATVDALTGLLNRHAFDVRVPAALAVAARSSEKLALLMIDIDHFKSYNDRFGHLFGDHALAEFARILRSAVRETDLVFRYGGEEFACALPKCDATSAATTWVRFRTALEEAPVTIPDGTRQVLRASGGLAIADADAGYDRRALIAAADGALYAAKQSGRDRLCAAPI
jgi:two-component system cell cycle response regulator